MNRLLGVQVWAATGTQATPGAALSGLGAWDGWVCVASTSTATPSSTRVGCSVSKKLSSERTGFLDTCVCLCMLCPLSLSPHLSLSFHLSLSLHLSLPLCPLFPSICLISSSLHLSSLCIHRWPRLTHQRNSLAEGLSCRLSMHGCRVSYSTRQCQFIFQMGKVTSTFCRL